MFHTMLPIHIKENTDKQDVLHMLQKVGAEYAILAFDQVILSAQMEKNEKRFAQIAEYIPFLKSYGFKVGIYFWSLWLTDFDDEALEKEVITRSSGKPRISNTALNSNEPQRSGFICPTSEKISIMLDIIRCAADCAPNVATRYLASPCRSVR